MAHFLAVSCMLRADTHARTCTHVAVELACLADVQDPAMKSAWESSGGPEQDTETETEREKEPARGCRAQIKFHCLFARPFPPPLHTSLPLLPSALPFLTLQEPAKSPSKLTTGQGCVSVIVKSPA